MGRLVQTTCFSCKKLFNKQINITDNHIDTDSNCWDCHRQLSSMSATRLAKRLTLPDLQGSEKQILWAEPVRIKVVNELLVRLTDFFDDGLQAKVAKKILLHILARPMFIKSSFWIEHRFNEYGLKNYILKLATDEIKKSGQELNFV